MSIKSHSPARKAQNVVLGRKHKPAKPRLGRGRVANKPAKPLKRKPATKPRKPRIKRRNTRQKLGLAAPASEQLAGTSLPALQKKWYKKLKDEGFDDIEMPVITKQGILESPYLRRSDFTAVSRNMAENELYWRMCRAYLSHNSFRGTPNIKHDKKIWELYCDGVEYRKMKAPIGKLWGRYRSHWWIFKRVEVMIEHMKMWNRQHSEGLQYVGGEDVLIRDMLLREPPNVPTDGSRD